MRHIQPDLPRCNLAVRGNVCAPAGLSQFRKIMYVMSMSVKSETRSAVLMGLPKLSDANMLSDFCYKARNCRRFDGPF